MRKRPAVSDLGKFLHMSDGEWAVHDMERAVALMEHPPSRPGAFWRICKAIVAALRGKPVTDEIPL